MSNKDHTLNNAQWTADVTFSKLFHKKGAKTDTQPVFYHRTGTPSPMFTNLWRFVILDQSGQLKLLRYNVGGTFGDDEALAREVDSFLSGRTPAWLAAPAPACVELNLDSFEASTPYMRNVCSKFGIHMRINRLPAAMGKTERAMAHIEREFEPLIVGGEENTLQKVNALAQLWCVNENRAANAIKQPQFPNFPNQAPWQCRCIA